MQTLEGRGPVAARNRGGGGGGRGLIVQGRAPGGARGAAASRPGAAVQSQVMVQRRGTRDRA